MNKEYANITIEQTSDNEFDIKIHGDAETLLKGLAAAVCQIISEAPLNDQQRWRSNFLYFLNRATIDEYRKDG